MIAPASGAGAVSAIAHARSILLSAYVLRPGKVLDALEAAAGRGASVTVRLEGRPYGGDDDGVAARLAAENQAVVDELRAAGAHAALVDTAKRGSAPLHLKAAVCDGVAYLDDRNWPDDGADTIVRDDFPRDVRAISAALHGGHASRTKWFWTDKGQALAAETRLLYGARGARRIDVESESFGYSGAYGALKLLAKSGVRCRLLVARRDVSVRSQALLDELKNAGVDVRVGDFDEKMAVVDGTRAWTGSANATFGNSDQLDWGLRTDAPGVVRKLERHFDTYWELSQPI